MKVKISIVDAKKLSFLYVYLMRNWNFAASYNEAHKLTLAVWPINSDWQRLNVHGKVIFLGNFYS